MSNAVSCADSRSSASVRYIGSKQRLIAPIMDLLGDRPLGARFVDGFCGTGVVAAAAADLGWDVVVNDSLQAAVVLSIGQIVADEQVPFAGVGGYDQAVKHLNEIAGIDGFVWREYSPAAAQHGAAGQERLYFTEENARRIDAIRSEISQLELRRVLSPMESRLLIADLLVAVSRVANTAGTYGCFMSSWQTSALGPITLVPRKLRQTKVEITISNGDVFNLSTRHHDLAYFDPPYTKRQYAAYYHVLETIAHGDEPGVAGVTGLRPWRHLASPFCYKRRALGALAGLVAQTTARRILLSYSDEGHVVLGELYRELSKLGEVTIHQIAEVGRYRPNRVAAEKKSIVGEYVIEIVKPNRAIDS